jgi:hypothetical protein
MTQYFQRTPWTDVPALITNSTVTASVFWPGGSGLLIVTATSFGTGGTVSLSVLGPDGVTYVSMAGLGATLSANGLVGFNLPPATIKAVVGGTGTSGIYASVSRLLQ